MNGIIRAWRFFKKNFYTAYGKLIIKLNRCSYGHSLQIRGRMRMFILTKITRNQVVIGDNCSINSALYANPIGGDKQCCFTILKGGKITLGNNVAISNSAIVSSAEIKIDDNVCVGAGCKIYDTDFHSVYPQKRLNGNIDINKKSIHICKNVFIGAHSIVLKGVTIGEGAVVGAGSVVTKNIPNYEIWAGNPAKFIRKITE